jgi:hypothetical protein
MIFFLSLMLLVWGAFRLMDTVMIRVIVIVRCKGCGIWVQTALWGTLFQLAISPFSWMDAAMEGVGERVGQMMETEADREPEEEKARRRTLSMEDLRRKYSWDSGMSGYMIKGREMESLVYEQPGYEVDGSYHSKEGSK